MREEFEVKETAAYTEQARREEHFGSYIEGMVEVVEAAAHGAIAQFEVKAARNAMEACEVDGMLASVVKLRAKVGVDLDKAHTSLAGAQVAMAPWRWCARLW